LNQGALPGRFIVFEGIEGAGKSTQLSLLSDRLRKRGLDPLITREPGGTPLGEELRGYLLARREEDTDPLIEAFLMVTDRADHVTRVLRPALEAGQIVLCDRYQEATLAYQGGGSGVDAETLIQLNRIATGGLDPDLIIFLDLPPAEATRRLDERGGSRRDRFESEPQIFFERVRDRYLDLASRDADRWVVLDALQDQNEIANQIEERVVGVLPTVPPTA
jgi:dTMP kinase